MIVLSAQCQAWLLIIGLVEQNPGPSTPEDVLAHLSMEAPSSEIRDCIRLYDQQRDYGTNKKLSAVPVGILVETMTYLGVPGQDLYVKPTIVHNLICHIQNLFPETCPICLESYCIGKDKLGLLPCSICGQACHTPCVLRLFGISEVEKNSFGFWEAECKMNLHHLQASFTYVKHVNRYISHLMRWVRGKKKKTSSTASDNRDCLVRGDCCPSATYDS